MAVYLSHAQLHITTGMLICQYHIIANDELLLIQYNILRLIMAIGQGKILHLPCKYYSM